MKQANCYNKSVYFVRDTKRIPMYLSVSEKHFRLNSKHVKFRNIHFFNYIVYM